MITLIPRWSNKCKLSPMTMCILCLAFVCFFLIEVTSCSKQPTFKGKPIDAWIDELDSGNSEGTREAAANAICHIGTNAIPFLLQEVTRFGRIASEDASEPETVRTWENRVKAFSVLGAVGSPAIPALTKIMNDGKESACLAVEALIAMGHEAVAPIVKALTNASLPVRICIVANLSAFGTNAEPLLPGLLQCLTYGSPNHDATLQLRDFSARALGHFQSYPNEAVPALIKAFQTDDRVVRVSALKAISSFGNNASNAIPFLEKAKADPDVLVREIAASTLNAIERQ